MCLNVLGSRTCELDFGTLTSSSGSSLVSTLLRFLTPGPGRLCIYNPSTQRSTPLLFTGHGIFLVLTIIGFEGTFFPPSLVDTVSVSNFSLVTKVVVPPLALDLCHSALLFPVRRH